MNKNLNEQKLLPAIRDLVRITVYMLHTVQLFLWVISEDQ